MGNWGSYCWPGDEKGEVKSGDITKSDKNADSKRKGKSGRKGAGNMEVNDKFRGFVVENYEKESK